MHLLNYTIQNDKYGFKLNTAYNKKTQFIFDYVDSTNIEKSKTNTINTLRTHKRIKQCRKKTVRKKWSTPIYKTHWTMNYMYAS